ncbi:hypothetical protein MMC10_002826 [Thelotrema lepadinum]|nr:hypothetical protein [Thelotrema lepadinum]
MAMSESLDFAKADKRGEDILTKLESLDNADKSDEDILMISESIDKTSKQSGEEVSAKSGSLDNVEASKGSGEEVSMMSAIDDVKSH